MSSPDKEKVEVVAPASLSAGFEFEAVHKGKSFVVIVPPGGVKKGWRFSAPLPSDFYDDEMSNEKEKDEETKENDEVGSERRLNQEGGRFSATKQGEESSSSSPPPPPGVAPVGGGRWGEERFVPGIDASSVGCFAFVFVFLSRVTNWTRTVYETLDGERYDAEGRKTTGGYDFEPFAPEEKSG